MAKKGDSSLRARARQHIRERGIGYLVGEAIVLAIALPAFHREAGWSLAFFLSTLTAIGFGVIASLVIFSMFMVASRPSRDGQSAKRIITDRKHRR